jgi:hypothetical protein
MPCPGSAGFPKIAMKPLLPVDQKPATNSRNRTGTYILLKTNCRHQMWPRISQCRRYLIKGH